MLEILFWNLRVRNEMMKQEKEMYEKVSDFIITEKNNTILDTAREVRDLLATNEACAGPMTKVGGLIRKLEDKDMTVSIIGQFKRGKSTLANKILEDEILPVGIVPITSAVTRVRYGERSASVHFQNGVVERIPFEKLSHYISEQENGNNKLGVASVELRTPSRFLEGGLTFVDTPGVGSFHKQNSVVAYHYMKESDAVIFLLSVDSPINEIEIEFLRSTRDFAAKFYFAVNKIDVVSGDDLDAYVGYCRSVLGQLMETEDIKIFPVSAKTGEGIDALEETIKSDCVKFVGEILEESAAMKLKDIINTTLTQLNFYWKAMNLPYRELDAKFAAVKETTDLLKKEAASYEGNFEIHLNEIKIKLSEKVLELFDMEYHYDIVEQDDIIKEQAKNHFLEQVEALCADLEATLDSILLYREEDAYKVYRRIYDLNSLTSRLRRIRDKEL